jgi:hypothetical protein
VGVCDVPVISTVCHTTGEAAGTLVAAPFDWLAQGVGAAAEWMFTGVWQLFDSTTRLDVTDPNYLQVYDVLFGVAIFVMLLFFCLQLTTGMIRRDPSALPRAALGLAKSVLGSFLIITLTGLALQITDELCVGIIQATGTTLEEMGGKIAALAAGIGAISLAAPGAGAVIIIFLGSLAITGAAIVWFSLLIRKALLLVAVVLAPVALSGQAWDAARGWFSKWASFVLALIVSKLIMVVVFLVAINQMNAPLDLDLSSIANPVAGIVLMFVAAFAPYMAYKFISFIGFDLHHVMSSEAEAKQAFNRPVPRPQLPRLDGTRTVLGGAGGPGGGGESGDGPGSAGRAPTGPGSGPTDGGSPQAGSAATAAESGAGGAAAGAAGGPAGLAVAAGTQAATSAAAAGPVTGRAVAQSAGQHADAGQSSASATPPATPQPPARVGGSPDEAPPPGPPRPSPPSPSQPRTPQQPAPGGGSRPPAPAPPSDRTS